MRVAPVPETVPTQDEGAPGPSHSGTGETVDLNKQEEAMRSSPGVDDSYLRDGGARSASDHWDDLIRGVDTVNDPSTGGTTQLSNLGQYHFTDGFGNYRTSDDPNYTPEKTGEVGSWTQRTAAP